MTATRELEVAVCTQFAFLEKEHGFKAPLIDRGRSGTRIAFLSEEIGFEFELDCREQIVCVLMTRLEDGRLPGGYYMNKGRRVRLHLERVLKDSLHVGTGRGIGSVGRSQKKRSVRTKEDMLAQIEAYAQALRTYTSDLLQLGRAVFENSE